MKPIEAKAIRLVLEHRINITWAGDGAAHGIVDGDTGTYHVSYSPAGRVCTCPAGANHRPCAHGLALELEAERQKEGVPV